MADNAMAATVESYTTYGGAADDTGAGVAATATGVYFSGTIGGTDYEGVVGAFAPALPSTPIWSRTWPSLNNYDDFGGGLAITGNGVYTAGRSWTRTSDIVGGKEAKGITVRFNLDGTAGAGVAGSVWDRQTPAAPGSFPYGGHEWLTGITAAIQAGQANVYTAGLGQPTGADRWGSFVTKLDEAGNVLWSKNDSSTSARSSTNPAVAANGDAVYIATRKDTTRAEPYLKKYDTAGTLQWTRTSTTAGEYRGVAVGDPQIYAVGQTVAAGGTSDFVVDAWDASGNALWTRTYDLGGGIEVLNAVLVHEGRVFAVGSTTPSDAGATSDAIILEIDGATGDLISSEVWGGTASDSLTAIAIAVLAEGPRLFAAGTTRSYGSGGSDILLLRVDPGQSNAVWTELQVTGTAPPHLHTPKSVFYDGANNRLIAFFPGSPNINPYGNEVWVITNANGLGGTPEWIKLLPTGTAPRSNGQESVVYDAVNNRLTVYGGCGANCSPALSDVYVLTNANGLGGAPAWAKSTVSNLQARSFHSAVYAPDSDRMITFGGNTAFFGTDKNDTRVLSNANGLASPSAWTTLQTSGGPPGIRNNHTAVYDAVSRNMVVFGGNNFISTCCPYVISDYNDTWMLSDADGLSGTPLWTQMVPGGAVPSVRGGHSAVYAPGNDRMIVFGGSQWQQTSQDWLTLADLWELRNATGAGGAPEWVELVQSGQAPGPQSGHGAAWDEANQRMMVLNTVSQAHRIWVLALHDGPTPPANLPPIANAGVSRQVKLGVQTVLDGRGSSDPEGQAITPSWSFLSRPAGSTAQLTGANTLQPSFVPDLAGQYKIRLNVTDPQGASASAMVTITASANGAPVAVIAPVTGSLAVPINKVLDGRGSSDPDGDPITFKWRLVSKPPASKTGALAGLTRPDPTLIMDVAGDYVVELTVLDPKGLSGKSQRTVTGVPGGAEPGNPDPIKCTIKSGVKPGTIYTVEWVECNAKRVSPDAYNTSRPGYVMEFLDPVPGVAGVGLAGTAQSVAYWSYKTESLTGLHEITTKYVANCTRNPLKDAYGNETPWPITGTAKYDNGPGGTEIKGYSISGMTVISTICKIDGDKSCNTVTKTLPPGCSTK